MEKKNYNVTVTSLNGHIWRYQVEGLGKASARAAAIHIKRTNKYKGKTEVIEVLTPTVDIETIKNLKPFSSDNFTKDRIVKVIPN